MREYEIPDSSGTCCCKDAADEELEDGFQRLRESEASTPLRKHLSSGVFLLLRRRRTQLGASLLDVVRAGLLHHDAPVGAVLPDPGAFDTFRELLTPLLAERHFGFDASCCHDSQPSVDWGDWRRLRSLDPQRRFIQRVCVSASRNVHGFRFTPTMTPPELDKVQEVVTPMLCRLAGEYRGTFDEIQIMHPSRKKALGCQHCLFDCGDKCDHAANIPRYWTHGRGVYVNCDRTFVVWVNAKDHLRVISQEVGGNLQQAYRRLADIMPYIDHHLPPARHERLGYLTVNLDEVGSGLRVEADVRFPGFEMDKCRATLEHTAKIYHMEIHWLQNDLYRVSSRSRLGHTEFEVMKEFIFGLRGLLAAANYYEEPKDECAVERCKERCCQWGVADLNILRKYIELETSSRHSRASSNLSPIPSVSSNVSSSRENRVTSRRSSLVSAEREALNRVAEDLLTHAVQSAMQRTSEGGFDLG